MTDNNNIMNIPQPKVTAMLGTNPSNDANARMQAANESQLMNNKYLTGGRWNRKGGSIALTPLRVPYTETAAGSNSVTSQQESVVSSTLQAQENSTYDKAAFVMGGTKKRNHKTKKNKTKTNKTNKTKTKRRNLRKKSTKHKNRR